MNTENDKTPEVEEGVTPPAELLLTEVLPAPIPPPKAKPHFKRFDVAVPAGYVMPLGEVVKEPFKLVVEAGVRWHPEWDAPKVCVTAYRFFHHGDALCWSGSKALAFTSLLPADVVVLANRHGQPWQQGDEEDNLFVRVLANTLGVEAPTAKEPIGAFVLPEQQAGRA